MAAFNVKAIFSLVDRMTAPVKKITGVLDGMGKTITKVADYAKALGPKVLAAQAALDKFGFSADRTRQKNSLLANSFGFITKAAAGLSVLALIRNIVDINAKFEGFQSALITSMGSSERAQKALGWISQFAATTPYDLDQVTDAFIKLRAYGFDPMDGSLKAIGDASSGFNRQLWQGVLAVQDATVGMYRELKEFGISAEENHGLVRLSWFENVKGTMKQASVVVHAKSKEMTQAVTAIFEREAPDAMKRMSGTFSGMMSNMRDTWMRLAQFIGGQNSFRGKGLKSGFFTVIEADLKRMSDWIQNPANYAKMTEWASKVGDALTQVYTAIKNVLGTVDWAATLANIGKFATFVSKIIDKAGGLTAVLDDLIAAWIFLSIFSLAGSVGAAVTAFEAAAVAAGGMIPAVVAAAAAFFGLDVAMLPVTLIVAAVAALAAIAYLVIRNWGPISKWWGQMWDQASKLFVDFCLGVMKWGEGLGTALSNWATKLWDNIVDIFTKGPERLWNAMPDWMKSSFLGGLSMAVPGGPLIAGAAMAPAVASAFGNNQPVKGKLDIHVTSDGQARVKDVQSSTPQWDFDVFNGSQALGVP